MSDNRLPVRRTDRLQIGRASHPGATYFVTFVTLLRTPCLADVDSRQSVLRVLREWHDDGDGAMLAANVMPDHVHVLFRLGNRLSVGQCVGRWKTMATRSEGSRIRWQRDFWEHRLRDAESLEDYAFYVFLNPYRACLARHDESWAGWWAPDATRFAFNRALDASGSPPVEWLNHTDDRFAGLMVGE